MKPFINYRKPPAALPALKFVLCRYTPVPKVFEDKLITLLKTYYITRGMPEAVSRWIETCDVSEVERIQDIIINSYELDFAKHAPAVDFPKLSLIWKSIPGQLAKENRKFVYGHVKPGARAKYLEDALYWLERIISNFQIS